MISSICIFLIVQQKNQSKHCWYNESHLIPKIYQYQLRKQLYLRSALPKDLTAKGKDGAPPRSK